MLALVANIAEASRPMLWGSRPIVGRVEQCFAKSASDLNDLLEFGHELSTHGPAVASRESILGLGCLSC